MKRVGIVSSNEWKGKIKEDLLLQEKLRFLGFWADIISWEDSQLDFTKYDCLVLRSAWGYHKKLVDFYAWLEKIEKSNIPLLNSPSLIRDNIKKDVQFEILRKHNIPTIDTTFIKSQELVGASIDDKVLSIVRSDFNGLDSIVIKPIVSGSGNNTYLLSLSGKIARSNLISIEELQSYFSFLYNDVQNGLMIQPFISEIDSGETSSVFIDGENTHNIKRYPSIFHDKRKPEEISLTSKEKDLARAVSNIPEYKDYLYMRVDMIELNGKPLIMEAELAEPDLLIKSVNDHKKQDEIIETFAKKLVRRM